MGEAKKQIEIKPEINIPKLEEKKVTKESTE